jgi:hypothetical protein
MASWMIHFRVADGIKDSIKNVDIEKFIVGNIAPDCGEWSKDGKTLNPPKYITHWKNPKNWKESLKDEFFLKYLADGEMSSHKSFYLGYYAHLLTDILWKKIIYIPTKEKYLDKFDNLDKLNSKIKADWSDIDRMFLRDNAFEVFEIFSKVKSFPNLYFNYYSEKAIESKLNKISSYYTNFSGNLDREYLFLNKEQADGFVVQAITEIKANLTIKGII